ncbi:MAG: cyclic nucleotide-binding domain-containing protein [Acidobacteriota bacterium]|nr:cyclic nucleotide-binding domain-containing protein [Blastocatellia bacterium]MDW8411096.1 cyclic nucleotide-binding domain-containing protein [Acidobacteriota bacterium]
MQINANEDLRFLRECDLFSNLSDDVLLELLSRGEVLKMAAGSVLFEKGNPVRRFFVIKSGVVEICRASQESPEEMKVVAYLGPSDSLGEMAMITGNFHRSVARLPEGGEVFILTREEFLRAIDELPQFTKALMIVFAQRLDSRVRDLRMNKRHLHGSLRFFDLPTVIQTVISSKLTGTLVITNEQQEPVAEVNFDAGQAHSAFFGDLMGEEAFLQLFQPPLQDGHFDFKSGPIQQLDDERFEIRMPSMNLLMEAVRLQDELSEYKGLLGESTVYVPTAEELAWDSEEQDYSLASTLWSLLQERRYAVKEIAKLALRCHYYTYRVLYKLYQEGQIVASC